MLHVLRNLPAVDLVQGDDGHPPPQLTPVQNQLARVGVRHDDVVELPTRSNLER